MITGFKLRITSAELAKHCKDRAIYHAERAAVKEANLPELRKSLEVLRSTTPAASVSHMNKGNYHLNTGEPVADLERDIAEHRNKVLVFRFFADHLFDEDYTLEESDLIRLEILKR